MLLFFLSVAPVLLLLFFIYAKDKYDKEPIGLIIKVVIFGALTPIPVIFIEKFLMYLGVSIGLYGYAEVFWHSFVVAGTTEEIFKFLVIFIFVWKHKEFNEKFDGIVYAAFASLGFALVENVLYVFGNGFSVGVMRAFTAVPAHAIFGITMGFFFGLAKFSKDKKSPLLLASLLVPIAIHGFYDFILMSENNLLLLLFIPYLIGMFVMAVKLMKQHSENSKFNPKNANKTLN